MVDKIVPISAEEYVRKAEMRNETAMGLWVESGIELPPNIPVDRGAMSRRAAERHKQDEARQSRSHVGSRAVETVIDIPQSSDPL